MLSISQLFAQKSSETIFFPKKKAFKKTLKPSERLEYFFPLFYLIFAQSIFKTLMFFFLKKLEKKQGSQSAETDHFVKNNPIGGD